jgi:hypothetical protein
MKKQPPKKSPIQQIRKPIPKPTVVFGKVRKDIIDRLYKRESKKDLEKE